jgi:predicted transcriptional regulator
MRAHSVRHLPVVDHGRIVGVVSQSDLRFLESLDRLDLRRVQVEEAMTERPYVVGAEELLDDVLSTMLDRHIGSVLVAERGRLVGIFTAVDAVAALRSLIAVGQGATSP